MILGLVLGILQTSLNALPHPLLCGQLGIELLILLLGSSQGPVGLSAEVGLNLSLIPSVLDPFLGRKDLLNDSRKSNKTLHEISKQEDLHSVRGTKLKNSPKLSPISET